MIHRRVSRAPGANPGARPAGRPQGALTATISTTVCLILGVHSKFAAPETHVETNGLPLDEIHRRAAQYFTLNFILDRLPAVDTP